MHDEHGTWVMNLHTVGLLKARNSSLIRSYRNKSYFKSIEAEAHRIVAALNENENLFQLTYSLPLGR
jgi:hypothetical protein